MKIDGIEYVPKSQVRVSVSATKKKGLEYCIVRTYSAGAFAGYFNRKTKGKEGTVYEARRLWYWEGANSLSELAVKGTAKPDKCKFPVAVSEVDLTEIIEVIPCTKEAQDSILGVKEWSQ